MSTLIKRIEELMESQGWDIQKTADIAGVSRSAVAQWLGQGSKIIHTIGRIDAAERLAKASGYNALWIARGEGEKGSGKVAPIMDWPLPKIDESKVRALSAEDIAALQTAILI